VHFFHELIATITTPSRFSRLSGAAVVPFFHHRLPGTGGYEILLLPALGDFPSGDDARDAERINRLIEEQIWRYPEQYLWIHRRFKSRPAGGEDIYRTS
jgi:KDO2-lipid IV(A) lauroyltransferase